MSYVSDAMMDAQEREIEKLNAENAQLRELVLQLVTPRQAIDTPVNVGTCHRIFIKDWLWECSECGVGYDSGHLFNFCPNCGRRVVSE